MRRKQLCPDPFTEHLCHAAHHLANCSARRRHLCDACSHMREKGFCALDRLLSSERNWILDKPPSPQPVLGLRDRAPQNLLGQAAVVCQQFPDWQVWPKMCSDSQLVHVRAGMLQNCTCLHLTERSHFKPGPCRALFPLGPELRPLCCQLRPPPRELCTQSTPISPKSSLACAGNRTAT